VTLSDWQHWTIPPNGRFFGKPLQAAEMIAEMQDMIGEA
jgi:hypothetical protein